MADASGHPRPPLRWTGVCLDCADAEELAAFYERFLGWTITRRDGEGWIAMRAPAGGLDLLIQAEAWYVPPVWPEQPGQPTKMLHFEIQVDDLATAVEHALSAGARLAAHQPQEGVRVLLDPAGHPFCLFAG
jgi:catechol 2,3-dioxygenase-like lactoylglutathione lyase family enzyme